MDARGVGDRAASGHDSDSIVVFTLAGGYDRSRAPNRIDEPYIWSGVNGYYPRGGQLFTVRPGCSSLLATAIGGGAKIAAMHVFTVSRTQSYLVAAVLNNPAESSATDYALYYIDLASAPFTAVLLASGLGLVPGSDPPPTFKTINGRLVIAARGQYLREWGGQVTGTLASYSFNAATAVDWEAPDPQDTIDLGVTPPAANTQVMVRGTGTPAGTLPPPLSANTRYFVRSVSGTTIKLSTTPTDYGIVNLTNVGTGTCQVYEVPARAIAVLKIDDIPTAGDKVTIGAQQYTWQTADRASLGQVTNGASKSAAKTNLVAALAEDSWDVRVLASQEDSGTNDWYVSLEYRRTGTVGNSAALSATGTAVHVDTAFSKGVNGAQLDTIDSYDAGKPGIVIGDRSTGRLVAGDCSLNPDRIYFSAPGNELLWSTVRSDGGKRWDMGYQEGNFVSAITPFFDELWVSKRGQDKEIKRAKIPDPLSDTWGLVVRPYDEINAALNHRSAAAIAGRLVMHDARWIGILQGDDTWNEIQATFGANQVWGLISDPVDLQAFVAVNQEELYALLFSRHGQSCLVYHFDGRWTSWNFAVAVCSALYCEPLRKFLVGTVDGRLGWLDPTIADDFGSAFSWDVETRAIEGASGEVLVKQVIIDYRSKVFGTGKLEAVVNRESFPTIVLADQVEFEESMPRAYDWALVYAADLADVWLSEQVYSRLICDEQATGEMVSFRFSGTGSIEINGAQARLARHGRANA